jgi:hypothetical protein
MENVVYFYNKLKMDSKLPYARFAARSAGPSQYKISIDALERDEIRFEKFLRRLRSIFQEILVKPLYIQMCLDFPELSRDRSFKVNLGLDFHRESQFEEQVQLSNYTKRTEFIKGLSDFKVKIGEEEKAYFDNNFLIQRFLGLSPDEIKMNEEYKKKEEKEGESSKPAEGEAGGAAGGEAGGPAPEGGEEPEVTL